MAIVFTLGLLGEPEAFQVLVSILEDQTKDTRIRGMCAEALADLRDVKAVVPLISALQDKSVEVRFWAIFSLGELGDSKALPELKRLADTDQEFLYNWGSIKDEALQAIQSIQAR